MSYKRDGGKILMLVGAILIFVSILLYANPGSFLGETLRDYRTAFLISLTVGALCLSYGLVLNKTAK